MNKLAATLCLTISVFLGSAGMTLACKMKIDTRTQLSQFLRSKPQIPIDLSENSNKIVGYVNLLSDTHDSECNMPIVLLREGRGWFFIEDGLVEDLFEKYCSSSVLHQTQGIRLLSEIPIDPPVGVSEIEQFAKRCKVQITGYHIDLIHRNDEIFKKFENRTKTDP